MLITKIINNNVISSIDSQGREVIITGRGIGFKRSVGDEIPQKLIERIYRMEDKEGQDKLKELVSSIPLKHIQITDKLIKEFRKRLDCKLNDMILVTLADHISFAIQRKEQGLEFKNPMFKEIMEYYPKEFQLGIHALGEIERELGVRLSDDEAAFIALHIISSETGSDMSLIYKTTQLIDNIVTLIEEYYNKRFDNKTEAFSRFMVHLRFFARKIFSGCIIPENNDKKSKKFFEIIETSCKKHYICAKHVAEYIKRRYNKQVSNEELVFLTIHLKRIELTANC